MSYLGIYVIILVTLVVIFLIQAWFDAVKKNFYANPIGKRCRYHFSGKWIKGTVEWNNGPYWYITPDSKKMATDLVNRKNVKPIYF
ncbi:hypothetical protein [Maribellus mangrovi]|uniref:hypothetical protein n=1 Tax=Maribellus mangrovi TaxID=3133146 RepID=UPI0030EDCA1D